MYNISITLILLCILICLIINISSRGKERVITDFKSSLLSVGLPIITMYQNNKVYHFILDTGCEKSTININSDIKYSKTKDDARNNVGITGEAIKTSIGSINVYDDKGIIYDLEVKLQNLDPVVTSFYKCKNIIITGLLGSDFMNKYGYIIDYNKYRIMKRVLL